MILQAEAWVGLRLSMFSKEAKQFFGNTWVGEKHEYASEPKSHCRFVNITCMQPRIIIVIRLRRASHHSDTPASLLSFAHELCDP